MSLRFWTDLLHPLAIISCFRAVLRLRRLFTSASIIFREGHYLVLLVRNIYIFKPTVCFLGGLTGKEKAHVTCCNLAVILLLSDLKGVPLSSCLRCVFMWVRAFWSWYKQHFPQFYCCEQMFIQITGHTSKTLSSGAYTHVSIHISFIPVPIFLLRVSTSCR